MQVRRAEILGLRIPFAQSFSHGTMRREVSDSVVVRVLLEDGTVGHGEGAPRSYVTGETAESVRRRVREVLWPALRGRTLPACGPGTLDALSELLPDAEPTVAERAQGVVAHHAARCALELALLDAVGRSAKRSVGACLSPATEAFRYGGVIELTSVEASVALAQRVRALGLTDCKVKVGDERDLERVAAVREVLGPDVALRVDANGVWDLETAVARIQALTDLGIDCCEEPLGRARRSELAVLVHEIDVPVLLDESLVTLEDADEFAPLGGAVWFDLRVSKCGGLAPCLALARVARAAGVGLVVGCQVGETSLLAAAGRHLAAHLSDHLRLEGSFGTLLLSTDVARETVAFGPGGAAPALGGPGLGVDVLDAELARHAAFREELR